MFDRVDWKAWLKAGKLRRRVRPHDLRHTCATLLLSGAWGEPWSYEAVKEMLGHSSVKVTERYAKALGTLAKRAAKGRAGAADKPETSPHVSASYALAVANGTPLRHTCATLLLNGDLGRKWTYEEVKELLDHSSVKVTERYAKVLGTLVDKAAGEMRTPRKLRKATPDRGAIGAQLDETIRAQAREIIGRRGSDSNRRMTVLQTVA